MISACISTILTKVCAENQLLDAMRRYGAQEVVDRNSRYQEISSAHFLAKKWLPLAGCVILLCLYTSRTGGSEPQEFALALAGLADEISESIASGEIKTVAVLPFTDEGLRVWPDGGQIADDLAEQLSLRSGQRFLLIQRRDLDASLKEHGFLSGRLETGRRFFEFVEEQFDVDACVLGRISVRGGGAILDASIVLVPEIEILHTAPYVVGDPAPEVRMLIKRSPWERTGSDQSEDQAASHPEQIAAERLEALQLALDYLDEKGVGDDSISKLRALIQEWIDSRDSGAWRQAVDQIHSASSESQTGSRVTVATEPRNGAQIRYQTWLERRDGTDPRRFGDPSVATEDLFLGEYYIWAERDGKPTSSKDDTFLVVSDIHNWTIQETD